MLGEVLLLVLVSCVLVLRKRQSEKPKKQKKQKKQKKLLHVRKCRSRTPCTNPLSYTIGSTCTSMRICTRSAHSADAIASRLKEGSICGIGVVDYALPIPDHPILAQPDRMRGVKIFSLNNFETPLHKSYVQTGTRLRV